MGKQKSFDFLDASKRHYSDAVFLYADARLANAAQLFGFAAECGVKALVEKLLNQPLPPNYYVHVNVLVNLLHTLQVSVNGRQGAKYLAMMGHFKAFGTWHTDHRYQSETQIPLKKYMESWAVASEEVQNMLQQAQIDSVLR